MSLNSGKNLEYKRTNNGFCIFSKSWKCLGANTVNRILGIRYVNYRSLSHQQGGVEGGGRTSYKGHGFEKNKNIFPHRHPEREREDNYEKRIRRVKKKKMYKN